MEWDQAWPFAARLLRTMAVTLLCHLTVPVELCFRSACPYDEAPEGKFVWPKGPNNSVSLSPMQPHPLFTDLDRTKVGMFARQRLAPAIWRAANESMKDCREVSLCSKPNAKGHVGNRSPRVIQQHLRMPYALHRHVPAWGYSGIFAKLCGEVHSAQTRGLCEVPQMDWFLDMQIDVLPDACKPPFWEWRQPSMLDRPGCRLMGRRPGEHGRIQKPQIKLSWFLCHLVRRAARL